MLKTNEKLENQTSLFSTDIKKNSYENIDTSNLTPMMEQYLNIKSQYTDCLLFYRMGDFYELFFKDALTAAKILNIVLTKRGKNKEEDIPMCGVPFHSYKTYLTRLVNAGYKIAICEQVESASQAKKRGYKSLVKREVMRVITKGTLIEDDMIGDSNYNFICSIVSSDNKENVSIAFIDVSIGIFFLETIAATQIINSITRIEPGEILIDEDLLKDKYIRTSLHNYSNIITRIPNAQLDQVNSTSYLKKIFNVSVLDSFGNFDKSEWIAAGILIHYINIAHKGQNPIIKPPKKWHKFSTLKIDSATRENLEINKSINGSKKGSLFDSIDQTITAMGSRLLYLYMNNPLVEKTPILHRYDCVEYFKNNFFLTEKTRKSLRGINDMERALTRILMMPLPSPKDILSLIHGLILFKEIVSLLITNSNEIPKTLASFNFNKSLHEEIINIVNNAFKNEVPIKAGDGNFIKDGYSSKLDEMRNIKDNTNQTIIKLQQKYISETGVNNLKIRHNNIVGYYVEVTSINSKKLDTSIFFQKQTMVNNVRFTTFELTHLETAINNATIDVLSYEMKLFEEIVNKVRTQADNISISIDFLSRVDLFSSLGLIAYKRDYTRPIIDDSNHNFNLVSGRHPVIENSTCFSQDNQRFVPNDSQMDQNNKIMLLTSPNMAGKSTYLRQCALLIIMAQMGSFVPAKSFTLSIVDKIFSRIGASDNLAQGRSTFMVEMIETATIMNQASERSFVILDEVGRGTSTYDGVAIAWSVLEYLHNKINCRCLFATHYHELTELENILQRLKCYTLSIKEWNEKLSFMYKLIEGKTNKSYGLHVASMSGMPDVIINRASAILNNLEKKS